MSTPILYAMLTDDALRLNTTKKVDTTAAFDQGYGSLYGEAGNYFNNVGILADSRKNRLAILDSTRPYGFMNILFDQDRFSSELLTNLPDTTLICLLNIIERCYLKQAYTDNNLEYMLRNTSSFNGYVENSYSHDTAEKNIKIYDINRTEYTILVNNWFSFEFNTGLEDTPVIRLHIWLSSESFANEYPYVTITSVIPPCDPDLLCVPNNLSQQKVTELLQNSSTFIFDNINLETISRDQNGVYIFRTKYVMTSSTTIQLPFALPYRGANEPSNLECRQAIRDYLKENTVLSDSEIEKLFPELFVESRFFIIPLWDQYSETCDRTIYTSIYSHQKMMNTVNTFFGSYEESFITSYLEYLTNAQNTMLAISLPDELNTGFFTIREQHPTYQAFATSSSGFRYMDAATQEFAAILYRAFAVLMGEAASAEFTTSEIDGMTYLVFTSGKSEYLMLSKDSYMTAIGG